MAERTNVTPTKEVGKTKKRRRWGRRVFVVVLVLVCVVGVMVWNVPRIAGTGWGIAYIEGRLNGGVGATTHCAIGGLDLHWNGKQRISGLKVTNTSWGEVSTDLMVELEGSLWEWGWRGSRDFGVVTVSGMMKMVGPEEPEETKTGGSTSTGPAAEKQAMRLPAGLKVDLRVAGLNVQYEDAATRRAGAEAVRIDDLKGTVAVGGGDVAIDLSGKTEVGDAKGAVAVNGKVTNLIAADGLVAYGGAVATLTVKAEALPAGVIDALTGQNGRLLATVGDRVDLDGAVEGTLESGTARVSLKSPKAEAAMAFESAEGMLHSVGDGRLTVKVTEETARAWGPVLGGLPEGMGIEGESEWVLRVGTLDLPLPKAGEAIDSTKVRLEAELTAGPTTVRTGVAEVPVVVLKSFGASVRTDNPVERIEASVTGEIQSLVVSGTGRETEVTAPLEGEVVLTGAVAAKGMAMSAGTLGVSGAVRTGRLPVGVMDALAGLDGLAVDVIGRELTTVEVTAERGAGGEGGGMGTILGLRAESESSSLRGSAEYVDGVLRGRRGSASESAAISGDVRVRPELVARLREVAKERGWPVGVVEAGMIQFAVRKFEIPFTSSGSSLSGSSVLEAMSFNAAGVVDGVVVEMGSGEEKRLLDKPAIAQGERVAVRLGASVRTTGLGARVEGDYELTGDVVAAGTFEVERPMSEAERVVAMTVKAEGLPTRLARVWTGEYQETVVEAVGKEIGVEATARVDAAGMTAEGAIRGAKTELSGTVEIDRVNPRTTVKGGGTQTITPRLVEMLRPAGSEVALLAPVEAKVTLNYFVVVEPTPDWPRPTFDVQIEADEARVAEPEKLREAVAVDRVVIQVGRAYPTSVPVTVGINGTLRRDGSKEAIGPVALAAAVWPAGSEPRVTWYVNTGQMNVAEAEPLFTETVGLLTGVLGERGEVKVEVGANAKSDGASRPVGAEDVLVEAKFDRLTCALTGRMDEDAMALTKPGTLSVKVERGVLEKYLAGAGVEGAGTLADKPPAARGAGPALRMKEDVTVTAELSRLSIPRALVNGDRSALPDVVAAGRANVSPIELEAGGETTRITGLSFDLSGSNLREGLRVGLGGSVTGSAAATRPEGETGAPAGVINLTGLVRTRPGDDSDLAISLEGKLERLPVALLDAAGNMKGNLTAAVGPTVDFEIAMKDAGREGGTVEALQMKGTHGWMTLKGATIADGVLATAADQPMKAMLDVTPEMSSTLLRDVNPIFYDVRKKTGPVLFEAANLRLPLDGDIAKLETDFTLDLGQVEVKSAGLLGELLGTMKEDEPETTSAVVPPIKGRVRRGVLHYDRMVLQSDRFKIVTSGDINLVKRTLNLLAEVPLIGWKAVFGDLTGVKAPLLGDITGDIPFYLTITGPIDKPKVQPDPKGAERVAKEFFKQNIEKVLGGALEELLGNPKKDEEKPGKKKP